MCLDLPPRNVSCDSLVLPSMAITVSGLLGLFPALITVVYTRMDHLKEQAEKVAFLFCFRFPFSKEQWLAVFYDCNNSIYGFLH